MMLKIAYLGEKFHGFAKQPGLRTVEGDLLNALQKMGYHTKIYPASRTDKGVSALSNVIQIDLHKDICRMLTASVHDIWVYGYCTADVNPRHCTKHYIYFLPGVYDHKDLDVCCSLFSGKHDFSAFSKIDKGTKNTVREIDVFHEVKDNVVLVHFVGKSFLWEMIRRCITGMKKYLCGATSRRELENMLQQKKGQKVPPAPAENLLLADLQYDFSFLLDQFSLKKMRKEFHLRFEVHSVKKVMFDSLLSYLTP